MNDNETHAHSNQNNIDRQNRKTVTKNKKIYEKFVSDLRNSVNS